MFKRTVALLFTALSFSAYGADKPISQMSRAIGMGDLKSFNTLLPQLKNVDEPFNPIGETPLTLAAYNDQYEMVDALLKKGAKVNYQTKNGYSALIFAAMVMRPPVENAIKTVRLLLAAGADKTLRNGDHDSAYDLALKRKQTELANLLK